MKWVFGSFFHAVVVFSTAATMFVGNAVAQSSYTYSRTMAIDYTKVPNTDQANFPLLFNTTDPLLKTVANGGHVTNANGYDIIFAADAAGAQKLNHEIESYNASTGQFIAWVQVPTVSHSADSVIYLFYGNDSVTTSQENKTGVWDSNYEVVQHLPNGTTLTANDSTSNGINGALQNSPAAASGQIDGAAAFVSSSSQYIDLGNNSSLWNGLTSMTWSAWIYPTVNPGSSWTRVLNRGIDSGWNIAVGSPDHPGDIECQMRVSSGVGRFVTANNYVNGILNSWNYVTCAYDGSTFSFYVNGVLVNSGSATGGPYGGGVGTYNTNVYIGNDRSGHYFTGRIDEVRVSNAARSADWIATEYKNQSSPGTFYTLGSEQFSGESQAATPTFSPAAGIYTSTQTVTISTTTSGASIRYTTDGSTPSEITGILYSAPIAVSATTTIKAIAYANGMVDSVIASAAYTINSGGNGYAYTRTIAIDYSKVPNTDQANFPLLFNTTDPLLKTVANGGHVTNANGYDIIFAADAAGAQKLNHEIESYNASTGQFIAWVQVPTVSHSADSVIYLFYGNDSVTTSQENKTGVWDSNYEVVQHLPNGTTLTANDSTSNGINGALQNSPAAASGQIDGAAAFVSSSSQYIDLGNNSSLWNGLTSMTWSAWIYPTVNPGSSWTRVLNRGIDSGWNIAVGSPDHPGDIECQMRVSSGVGRFVTANNYVNGILNSWNYVTCAYDGSTFSFYVNGVLVNSGSATGGPYGGGVGTYNTNVYIGNDRSGHYFTGRIDEVRVSNAARSADWIATEYKNQSSPGTFYTLGSEQFSGESQAATPTFSPAAGIYTSTQTVTISTTTSGASIRYTTDGSTPSEITGILYSAPIAVSATTTIKAIAYANGMVDSPRNTATYTIQVVTPTFSPAAGTYTSTQTVTISTTTSGASIRYTTDGSTPSNTAGSPYTGPITVSSSTTIKAVAYASGLANSTVNTATYTIQTATPTFSPAAGTYNSTQTVTISTTTSGASIRYTTDGSTPSETAGTLYSGPVTVGATVTINAIAYKSGLTDSAVATAVYTINAPVAAPTFSPAAGTYTSTQTVTISTTTSGASIRYTMDGSTPSETAGTLYSGPVTVGATTAINAIAYKSGMTDSAVAGATYTIAVATPTFSPVAGTYSSTQTVTISTTTSGASIRYTTDGSTPSETAGTLYSGPVTVSTTTTINAIAYQSGLTDSAVTSAAYTITLPTISGLSPTTGAADVQITISGTGFGSTQGAGAVWLGSNYATVISWSATQIVARVASNSTSGTARVRQGVWSNAVPLRIITATISNISPPSGLAGTQVTIAGSGFGAAQGGGQVWLGTANGVVQSWSDTQVVALVAAGSASGNAQILQNGVWSNAVPFTVNTPQITAVNPTSGVPGTSVTFTGTGFGSSQGSGTVWLGSTNGLVTSWSDTQVVATVAPTALTGIARINQNGLWSKAIAFTVPGGNATLVPNLINMVVGDTHTIQALGSNGLSVAGLTWTSSDPTVVGLSSADPPLLSALAAGHVTITAGSASADVTVSSVALPLGTVLWSNPGDGSGVNSIVPAVPSPTGVADVFAVQNDGTVQAITSDGTTAWTANLIASDEVVPLPDFQGGLVLADVSANTIMKLDGITGQAYPAYSAGGSSLWGGPVLHPDGTIFIIQRNITSPTSLVGIDPLTGTQKFSIPLEAQPYIYPVFVSGCSPATYFSLGYSSSLIVAGDGYAYVVYEYPEFAKDCSVPGEFPTYLTAKHIRLLRVSSSGAFDQITIADLPAPYQMLGSGFAPTTVSLITNADSGVLVNWNNQFYDGVPSPPVQYGMAVTTGTSVSFVNPPLPPTLSVLGGPVVPQLQAQDGSFVGWFEDDIGAGHFDMVAFDASGNVRWVVPNEFPQIATVDGGVIGTSGITYDTNGNATGQSPTSSGGQVPGWLGSVFGTTYSLNSGALFDLAAPNTNYASSFTAFLGGNPSGGGTAIEWVMSKWTPTNLLKQLPNITVPACYPLSLVPVMLPVGLLPTCGNINAIELLTTQSPDFIFQNFIQTFAPVTAVAPNQTSPNSVMTFAGGLSFSNSVNVTAPGQILTIKLKVFPFTPFAVVTERVDPVARVISAVTLLGHPLAGWRYWRVYSIGTNDVVIETGAYDQPAPVTIAYAGYYIYQGTVKKSWMQYLQYIKTQLAAPQGSHLNNSLGGISLRSFPPNNGPLLSGYWDYFGDFTNYILNNVCQATTCN